MAIVRFDQDPELPMGAGLFHADDGRSFFAHDPALASSIKPPQVEQPNADIMAAAAPPPDMRTAGGDVSGITSIARDLAGGQAPPAPPLSAPDVQPARVISEAAPPPPPPQNMPQELPTNASQQRASDLATNTAEYVNRPVRVGATRGGVVPQTQAMTVETQGMPYDPDSPQAMDRRAAHIAVQQAGVNAAETTALREAGAAAAYRAALPELQEKAAEAERVQAIRRRGYEQERKALDDMTKASESQQKSFDANRFYQRAGVVGQIGAAIAQAFGAYAATLRGGPNLIAQQIHEYIDADVANQRAEIEAGKAGVNNQLAKMNRQFGDLDQAEAALKIAQQKISDNMAASYAASTKSEDVMKSLDSWLAEGQQRYVTLEQQFEDRAYGKRSVSTAAKMIAPSAGGVRDPTEPEKIQRLTTLQKFGDVQKGAYEGEITRRKAEEGDPEKAEKVRGLVIEDLKGNQILARSEPEATKIREMKSLHTNAAGAIQALDGLAERGSSLSPDDLRAVDLNIEAVVNGANTIAGQNAVKGEDMDRYKKALKSTVGAMPAKKAVAELKTILDRTYQARVDAQRGSAVKESQTGKGSQVQYTGEAAQTTTDRGRFKPVGSR